MLDVHEQNKIDVVAKRMKLSKNETSFFFCLQKCVEKNILTKKNNKKKCLAKRRVLLVQFSRICIRLTERERESWTRGVRTEEKKKKKKQNKRTESMLEECARPLANPSAASFFPLFLSNSVSLFLSSSPLSFSNH